MGRHFSHLWVCGQFFVVCYIGFAKVVVSGAGSVSLPPSLNCLSLFVPLDRCRSAAFPVPVPAGSGAGAAKVKKLSDPPVSSDMIELFGRALHRWGDLSWLFICMPPFVCGSQMLTSNQGPFHGS